jgi:hypothetical protein
MAESHLILLPRVNYFKWVRAAQKYALAFGVNITPDPPKAGGVEVITIAVPENGYPEEGDITIWLKARYPNTTVDAIRVETPEELKEILDQRAAANQRYGEDAVSGIREVPTQYALDRLYLFWPTDYPEIIQRFGANPEIYSKWGLHGHEGIDIRAPHGSAVYACADGEVMVVENDPDVHVYGRHVRIRHVNGYKTIYAHLEETLVEVGQQVTAKEPIGKADSSGNSSGSHLHLTLKKEGASVSGETDFPGDIIDPTPYLVYPHQEAEVLIALGLSLPQIPKPTYPWSQPCLVGLNGRIGGTMQEVDFTIARTAQIEALKIPANTPDATITKLKQMLPDLFLAARATFPLENGKSTPEDCLKAIKSDLLRLYEGGVRFFEIHQSPNLQLYGLDSAWRSGGEFAACWLEVTEDLREDMPEARFGFPGVSPGGQVSGQRLDAMVFIDQADEALLAADWIGVNCFWSTATEMHDVNGGGFYHYYRQRYPDKLLFITEFGDVNRLVDPYVKGQEYVAYFQSLREQPGIGAAFAQVISAAGGYAGLAWRDEDGRVNKIPHLVGRRQF